MRTKPTACRRNYGERLIQDKQLADWISGNPRRGLLLAVAQNMDKQREFAERVRKRK